MTIRALAIHAMYLLTQQYNYMARFQCQTFPQSMLMLLLNNHLYMLLEPNTRCMKYLYTYCLLLPIS